MVSSGVARETEAMRVRREKDVRAKADRPRAKGMADALAKSQVAVVRNSRIPILP